MQSQYVCRETQECNGLVNKTSTCEKCGKPCQEELLTGEIVIRKEAPSYILEEIDKITNENTRLIDEWLRKTQNMVVLQREINANFDRRVQLENKMKNTIENGLRKLRLHKNTKGVRWGFDHYRRTFAALRKPISKVIESEDKTTKIIDKG